MLPCKDIVKIISSHEEISWMRRAELRVHLMMCKHCSNYASHLRMMKEGFKKLFSKITHVNKAQIIQLESEILDELEKNTPK